MVRGKLDNGFEFEFDETIVDDMYFFEKLAGLEENPLLFPSIIEYVLGKEQKEKFYKSLEVNGKVSAEACGEAFAELLGKANETKN